MPPGNLPSALSPNLDLTARSTEALVKAGITEVNQFLSKLAESEAAVLAIEGFGQKSLIDAKKKLRALGYELPEAHLPRTKPRRIAEEV